MQTDVVIIGAGAAGLMCAIQASKRGRQVVVLDHANKVGKKILMSGGGRCNFTNLYTQPEHFISHNPHFCKSALSRYQPSDFVALVRRYHIPFHEKTKGQLFCDQKSSDIVEMLLSECEKTGVKICLNTKIETIYNPEMHVFKIATNHFQVSCESLVIATGGLSIPTLGASAFGYQIAEQFGIHVWPTRAGLVPLTLHTHDKEKFSPLSGVSVESLVQCNKQTFHENILFTHRGLSGPAILQISSYWQPGDTLMINLLPHHDLPDFLKQAQHDEGQKQLKTVLGEVLPKRLIEIWFPEELRERKIKTLSPSEISEIAAKLHHFTIGPNGTEGYRTAEVTLGGVDCDAISSKTMEAQQVPGLYFIGEVLDVTGWLGGYNFQWAWASAYAAGQVV